MTRMKTTTIVSTGGEDDKDEDYNYSVYRRRG